jgi:hypothetical protein
MPLHRCDQQR